LNPIGNELIICYQSYNDTVDFRKFGNTLLIEECNVNLGLLGKDNYTTYFYQMYLKLGDNNFRSIPVRIENNDNSREANIVKRFFIAYQYDTERQKNYILADRITFEVRLLNENPESLSHMQMPILKIHYKLTSYDPYNGDPNEEFMFSSNYYMDISKIMKLIKIFFAICFVLVFLAVAARMYVWCILNPSSLTKDSYPCYFLINLFAKIFKYFGIIMFFFTLGIIAYWYIFYKCQYRPFVFFPDLFEKYKVHYRKFDILWGLACGCYGFYMFFRIYEQINCDIFFIDWEHEKDILETVMGKTTNKPYKSPWRSIHIVNQFNLLQKSKTISFNFCFIVFLMFYYSNHLEWHNYTHLVPNASFANHSPPNRLLRQFLATFIIFITGAAQYVLRRIIQPWLPTPTTEFLDLCSVANVSVLILQDSLRGYYIHGQSPLGKADVTLQELIRFLEEEGKGKIKGRGITDDKNDNLQTYEIYLSYTMRQIYDGLYFFPTLQEIDKGKQYDRIQNQAKFVNVFKYIPESLHTGNIYEINKFMNNHLKEKIEQVTMQKKLLVKEKSMCERFFEFPPSIDLTSRKVKELVFYKDPGRNFEDVLFIGMELEWLIFVIYIFNMWCIALEKYGQSLPISILMTYVMERIFWKIRIFFGEKNVAKKAVVDNRFL
jgi:meckelin